MPTFDDKNYDILFQNKEYDKAFIVLEKNRKTMEPAVFHYNMGLLNQKINKLSIARFHFEKAQDLGLSNKLLVNNLESIKEKLNVISLEKSESLNDYFYASKNIFNMQYVSVIILALSFIILLFSSRIKKGITIFTLCTLFIVGVSIFVLTSGKDQIILVDDAKIYEGPSRIFETTQLAPKGMRIVIEKSNENWIRVIWPSQYSGWVLNQGYKIL